jgi:hypothetical protein
VCVPALYGAPKLDFVFTVCQNSVGVVLGGGTKQQVEMVARPRNHLNLRCKFAQTGRPEWAAFLYLQIQI